MKKVIAKGLAFVFVGSLSMAGSAMALPFVGSGVVNPYLTWDETAVSGTAQVELSVQDVFNNGADVEYAQLVFEGDIFSSVSNIAVTKPDDWSTSAHGDLLAGDDYQLSWNSGGTSISETNSPLVITFDYTLIDIDRLGSFSSDSGDWMWDEGQVWGLSFTLMDLDNSVNQVAPDSYGGSTAPIAPVPEPATMLLFGSGLAGLAGYHRKKAAKK